MSGAGMGRGLRKLSSDFSTSYISEAGTQNKNSDYFAFMPLDARAESAMDFLTYDRISFLVSEAQMVFPEYNCIGECIP